MSRGRRSPLTPWSPGESPGGSCDESEEGKRGSGSQERPWRLLGAAECEG